MTTSRAIYVGTDDGLFRLSPNGGQHYEVELLGLRGAGMVAHPPVVDCSDPNRLYVGTYRGGMWRSLDAGQTWAEINDGIMYKEVWSLVQHPLTGVLYAGTGPSSVFRSDDGGNTWQDCDQLRALPSTKDWDFPTPPHISHVRNLSVVQSEPEVVLGAIEVGWMVRSDDGGRTWRNLTNCVWQDSHTVTAMPDDPRVLVVTSGGGVYRSEDGGETFESSCVGIDRTYMAHLALHPDRPSVLFTAGAEGPPFVLRRPQGADSAFYRSDDQGKSWRRLTGGLPQVVRGAPRAVAGDPGDPDAFLVGLTDGGVWLTDDGGESFQEIAHLPTWVRSLRVVRR